jgi:site-specific recombinase XerD
LDRHVIGRIVRRVGRAACVPGVHPHRLRRTLATQAINRGMRLEAIAALLGRLVNAHIQLASGWLRRL